MTTFIETKINSSQKNTGTLINLQMKLNITDYMIIDRKKEKKESLFSFTSAVYKLDNDILIML